MEKHRQRCGRLESTLNVEKNISFLKTDKATCGIVHFYSAGVVTHDRVGLAPGFAPSAI
jgi:hypothetical protein